MSAAQDDDTRDGVWEPRFAPVAQIIPPNVFADMDVKVAAAVASGADVIDLAKGNPDAYPAEFIRRRQIVGRRPAQRAIHAVRW